MRIRVLGAVELLAADRSGVALRSPRLRRLLVALLVRAGDVVSTDRLVADVWGAALPADPANALQILVSRLRRTLGPEPALRTRSPGYVLDSGGTDADAFEMLLAEARTAPDPARTAALLDDALGLWRGRAFAELADEEFVRPAAVRLDELRLDAEAEWADAVLGLGRAEEAVLRLEPLVRAHPLREALRSRLMLALYRAGRQADALERYAEYRRTLADELGVDPSPPLQELHERVLRQDPELAGALRPTPAQGAPTTRPVSATGLVGRESDLARVAALLDAARIVTLTGPGGVGKTRLALAAAAGCVRPDGAWVVELAAVRHTEAVTDAVATTLGVQGRQEVSVRERVVEYLRPLRLLLMLDNCEHVAAAAAPLAAAIAGSCPGITVLATSREPLGTEGERVVPVAPLPVPPSGEGDPETIAAVPAVRLLLDRAAAAAPGFALDAGNAAGVAALVRGLDGLPLALELAAPRLRALRPAELAERLDGRLGLLRARCGPARHRTLSALVEWSHELLTPSERHCFVQLAVFAGPFGLAAAEAVCGGEDDDGDGFDVAAVVADLVDRSMLTADTSMRPTRYSMLETLRAFGRARLAGSSTEEVARRAHAEYVVAHAEAADRGLRGPEEAGWTDELIRGTDDLRAAHRWALQADPALAVRLAAALVWFAKFHLPPEVPSWAEETAETVLRAGAEVPRLPVVLGVAAAGARTRGDHARAAELAERGVGAAEDDDDPDLRYPLLVQSGLALFYGRLDEADGLADLAARLARTARDPAWAAHATANRSMAATYRGDAATAERLAEDAVAIAATTSNPTAMGWASYAAAEAVTAADPDRAAALLDRARDLATAVRNRYLAGVALVSAAALHGRHGDPATALRLSGDVIDHWHRAGNRTQQWTTIRNVVELLSRLGADEPAAVLDAAAASRTTSAPAFGAAAARLERARAVLRQRLDPAAYTVAVARGRTLTDDEVVALARDAIARTATPSPVV